MRFLANIMRKFLHITPCSSGCSEYFVFQILAILWPQLSRFMILFVSEYRLVLHTKITLLFLYLKYKEYGFSLQTKMFV